MQGAESLIFLGLLIGLFYFMLIRPQKKRVNAHRALIESVDVGDEIVTIGGMFGRVSSMGDEEFELEVASGTRIRFVKSAIARRVVEDLQGDEAQEDQAQSDQA